MIRVIQVGVSLKAKGGVTAVIASLLEGLRCDSELRVTHIPTTLWRAKGILYDIVLSVVGLFRAILACIRSPRLILHLHMSHGGSAIRKGILVRLAGLLRVPCIIHTQNMEEYYGVTSRWMRAWIRGTFRRARAVLTTSDRETQFTQSLTPSHVETVPNAVPLPEAIERARDSSNRQVRFLFLGRLAQVKGVFELLEAFAALRQNGYPVRLTLAGNSHVAEVRDWVRTHGLDGCVDVPGWLTGDDKAKVFREADIFVLATYHKEGLPVAIVEAMSYGLPVIATRAGGIAEAVVENETGLFVEPRDVGGLSEAMRRLASDGELRCRLGQASRKRVEEKYALPSICGRIKALYKEVLSRTV